MPLLVEGRRVRLPQSASELVRAHPSLEERARLLRGQSVQQVGPQGLLYVQQRELAFARLEVHLVGGFSDDRQLSQKLTHQLLSEFDRQKEDIHLVTLCVTELNDREENESHFPIIYGIAVNIKTAEIYRASFKDRGPEEELRAARALTGGPMISIYDAKTEQLRIGPYSWLPFPHVDFWLQQDDKQILENLSTSPLAEPPHFVEHIRSTLLFLKKYPSPMNALFPEKKALLYKKNGDGLWEKSSSPADQHQKPSERAL
ncbi:protein N-terminal asparagine amidohydrolase [Echinops telfairi]|uniref:Protein N-terminal asparagine amidohydrolase n=1 Tax=Echinops telfairi TaxID=9371 RepID=A0AC55CRS5_ECHTE|nr:protein N-terminal asparagine amidohydrolase [Echinops telfairi]